MTLISPHKGRCRRVSEFRASLVYRVSSRTARLTQRNPVSKNPKRKKEGKKDGKKERRKEGKKQTNKQTNKQRKYHFE